jgi:hypothetical protein
MNAIADALVYAVVYLNVRPEENLDSDVGALESIAGELKELATDEEKDALAAAAERALAAEKGYPREEFIRGYSTWMEDMFGDEDWDGNRRKMRS